MTSAHGRARGVDVVVDQRHAGARLDQVVAAVLDTSRSRAARRITDGDVTVDGAVRSRSSRLIGGERLVVAEPEATTPTPPPPMPPLLHRDEHLAIVDKPAGLVVHPGHGHPDGTLVDALLAGGLPLVGGDVGRPGIVHRLDKDTSGAMVVALDAAVHAALVEALRDRQVTRSYLALVDGELPAARGTIDVPLGRDPRDRTRFAPDVDGRNAVTHFAVQAVGRHPDGRPVQVVACRLETGRTHQIRVHLAHAGARVSGDVDYHADADVAAAVGLHRPFLHALHLRLVHPVTGEVVAVEAPLPEDLTDVLDRVGIDATARASLGAEQVDWPADAR